MIKESIDAISDPVTGQRIVFRDRTPARVRAELFVQPGGFVPSHVHGRQWERFEGVSGQLLFRLGRVRRTVGEGEIVVVPPGTAHGLRNVGSEIAHFLIELSPPRRGEEGLRTLFGLQLDGRVRVTRFSARPLLQIAVLFDEYLDEVHLPVVPFRLQQLAFRTLARLGRRRGYGSVFPEYAAEQRQRLHGKVETAGVEPAPPRCKRGALPPEPHPPCRSTTP
jgi:mannose-6-phosphate isomerase-like protein (cupin superfamily)